MSDLILSIFPGLGLLDRGFEAEGFCCVRGPDVIWGGDVRTFKPPAGRFDGVIGGDPCQSHSSLANLVRAKGLEPSFPDLTPEFQRVIEAARPRWFLRENVPKAPDVKPLGYEVTSFLLCNSWLDAGDGHGEEQMRKRRFWFGWPSEHGPAPNLMRWIRQAVFELPAPSLAVNGGHDHLDFRPREKVQAVAGDARAVAVAVAVGGSGKVKRTAAACDGRQGHRIPDGTGQFRATKAAGVTGRHPGEIGLTGGHRGHAPRYSLAEMLELQGLPPDFLDHCPFTVQGKRKAIGNGVPQSMARAVARAVRTALAKASS